MKQIINIYLYFGEGVAQWNLFGQLLTHLSANIRTLTETRVCDKICFLCTTVAILLMISHRRKGGEANRSGCFLLSCPLNKSSEKCTKTVWLDTDLFMTPLGSLDAKLVMRDMEQLLVLCRN